MQPQTLKKQTNKNGRKRKEKKKESGEQSNDEYILGKSSANKAYQNASIIADYLVSFAAANHGVVACDSVELATTDDGESSTCYDNQCQNQSRHH